MKLDHQRLLRLFLIAGWIPYCVPFAAGSRALAEHHPIVPGYQRFALAQESTDGQAQIVAGRLLLSELNCVGCHQDSERVSVAKSAPDLTEAGRRLKPAWLLKFLANPHATKPGTTMPDLLGDHAPDERETVVQSLVHYLVSVGDGELPVPGFVSSGSRVLGEKLFHTIGCVACHGAQKDGAPRLPYAVPLGDLDAKYTVQSLKAFLRDPLHVRTSGRMPAFAMNAVEAEALAAYLVPSAPDKPGIQYTYYEGVWDKLPDFSSLQPVATGTANSFDVHESAARNDRFGLRFQGLLMIDQQGEYTFEVRSDDGSRLSIDGQPVLENDGVHGETTVMSKVTLTKGPHAVMLDFFEKDGGEALYAWYRGPGVERRELFEALISATPSRALETIAFPVDPDRARAGAMYFRSLGCVQCHELNHVTRAKDSQGADSYLASHAVLSTPLREESRLQNGCLAESNAAARVNEKSVPWYGLDDDQRKAIRAALRGEATSRDDASEIHLAMRRMNCLACHERDKRGGLVEEVNVYFTGTQPEMGDEGRVPPYLSGVGGKIRTPYLANLLAHGGKDRPYMMTRMPGFGAANTSQLVQRLARQDVLTEKLPEVKLDFHESKKIARTMVGAKGFGCIKCHTFGRFEATGVQSIDMTRMTTRLQEEWFRQYLHNPIAFRPGTRMPSAWPLKGPSMLPQFYAADSEKQIQAVWNFLLDGARARIPDGLGTGTLELVVGSEAVIYRNFVEGAGSRAIAVGLPEGFNYAFDANELRLALIWQGPFLDASRHWKGRGQGWQPPLGDKIVKQPDGVAFAVLSDPHQSWPTESARESQAYQFLGYTLGIDRRPMFRYRVGAFEVHDLVSAVDDIDKAALTRRLEIHPPSPTASGSAAEGTLVFRVARGAIEKTHDGFQVGSVGIHIPSDANAIVAEAGGQKELRIALKTGDVLELQYVW